MSDVARPVKVNKNKNEALGGLFEYAPSRTISLENNCVKLPNACAELRFPRAFTALIVEPSAPFSVGHELPEACEFRTRIATLDEYFRLLEAASY